MEYTKKHPCFEQNRLCRELAMDLYEGGRCVEVERVKTLLTKHPFETPAQYDIRVSRATYRNFAAPIVDVFSGMVCEGRPERTLPDALKPIEKDADRLGNDAGTFFDDVVRNAAGGGARFVLVDMEPPRGDTLAADKQAGRRLVPYFVDIDADNVWDWGLDDKGLAWVVIHSTEAVEPKAFEVAMVVDVLTVWTRATWQKFKGQPRAVTIAEKELTNIYATQMMPDGEPVAHPCGMVPLVPFLFEPRTPMTGNPATDDVLSLIVGTFRRYSELDKMLFDRAVPLLVVTGLSNEDGDNFVMASSNMLTTTEKDGVSAAYVEPTGTSFEAQTAFLANDIQQIREIALRMVRPDSAVGQSAESKKLDNAQLDTQLAKFARRCAAAEKRCWMLAAAWMGMKNVADDAILTPYNEDYSEDSTNILDKAFVLELTRLNVISKVTALELLMKTGTLPEDFDPAAEADKVAQGVLTNAGQNGSNALSSLLKI
jgi:hypothetical protein|nr:MAG TPA: portal [Bacteriophage sp.]